MRLPEAFLTLDVTVRRTSAPCESAVFLLMFIKTLMNEDYFTGRIIESVEWQESVGG